MALRGSPSMGLVVPLQGGGVSRGDTCSQRHAALLLLICDWTDAIRDVFHPAGERGEGREAAHAAHLHRAQRQVAHEAGAVLDKAV